MFDVQSKILMKSSTFYLKPTEYTHMHTNKNILLRSIKIYHLFLFSSVSKNLSLFTFIIIDNGFHIPLTQSHLHFIIKLTYKSMTHMPLIFSNPHSITFLNIRVGLNGDKL